MLRARAAREREAGFSSFLLPEAAERLYTLRDTFLFHLVYLFNLLFIMLYMLFLTNLI